MTITVHGHPVAELGPAPSQRAFVPSAELIERLAGTLSPDDDLAADLRAVDDVAIDPFE